jgi:hypothetical protein
LLAAEAVAMVEQAQVVLELQQALVLVEHSP